MPQLNPSPWFLIMLLVWTTILIIMMQKISTYKPTSTMTPKSKQEQHNSWNWPW